MRKFLLKVTAIAGTLAMLCSNVLAAQIPYTISGDYTNNKVTISGTIGKEGKFVSLQVLDQYLSDTDGKYYAYTYDDLAQDRTNKDLIFYRSQIDVNDSSYSFTIRYSDDTAVGYYNGRLVTDGAEEMTDFRVPIVSNSAYKTALGYLNSAADAGVTVDFVDIIKENSLALGMETELLEGLDGSDAMKPYMDYVKMNHLDSSNSVKNTREYNTYVLMAALGEGDVKNIDSYVSGTVVFGTELYNDYDKLVDEKAKQAYLTAKMADDVFDDTESFVKSLKQALIFEEVYYATGYGEVKDIISKYGSTVGITGTAANEVYKELQGKDYEAATILADYNSLKEKYGSGGTSGGGGGGGAGGITGGTGRVPEMDGAYGGFETGTVQPETVNAYFHDIDGVEWAIEAILALADEGIINGKSEGYFVPDDFVTREEFAKILVGSMGYSGEKYQENIFNDVNDNDWFKDYVNIAYSKKLIKGTGNGRFGSGQLISRQDMAVMLYNALKTKGVYASDGNIPFEDKAAVADYAVDAIGTLYKMGIINGVSETRFDPLGNATRAQAAKMVYGVLKSLQ